MKALIILPTYNEKDNIEKFINALLAEFEGIEQELAMDLNILVVDDYSPDGTGEIVEKIALQNSKIHLIKNNNRGLGNAYIKGFKHAINVLDADVVMEMDSDFSHSPKDVIRLLREIKKGNDFVIGSRYVRGGSIPKNWSYFRKLNSYYGNVFARYIAGIVPVKDCTSGFRAIKTSVLKKIDLDQLNANGYSFQMKILYESVQEAAQVFEVPIHFIDREFGDSKLSFKDIIEFMQNSFVIMLKRNWKY